MLKKLRLHLTGVCILMTGMVFSVLLALHFFAAAQQYRGMRETLFASMEEAVAARLLDSARIDPFWLAEIETARRCIVSVTDNGRPLFFNGAWTPPTDRGTLVGRAGALALEQGVDITAPAPTFGSDPASVRFTLTGDGGDRYRAAVAVYPLENGRWFSLTILQELSPEARYLRRLLLRYAMVGALVFAALCLFSWFLAGRAVRPAAESMERQREFIAAASHELRSPVAVITASASAIRVDPEQSREMLGSIESECGLLTRLVDDLLLLANMDTAAWHVDRREVDMDTVLIDTVEKLAPVAAKAGFSLGLDMPEEALPPVTGDAGRIGQMAAILIDNAVKHSGRPGLILLRARRRGRFLVTQVIDHGAGIPPEARRKVFDRFYSVSASRSQRRNFGLGLSIAAELARLHGGSLTLEETPGGGCTFCISLPIR